MERKWVSQLKQNQAVKESYLVWRKNLLMARNGKPYLNLIVGDKTGKVEGRVWNRAAELDKKFEAHDIVSVTAKTTRYQDRIQLNISEVARLDGDDQDLALYVPSTTRSIEKMWTQLCGYATSLTNPHLRELVTGILSDPAIAKSFQRAPAAKSIHHARAGGLLEHVLSVVGLADSICKHYEGIHPGFIDRDLVLAGAILHDLGKIWELTGPTFQYSDTGRLLGHIVLVYEAISDKIKAQPGFPPELANHLKHILLSHHGELEYGSPKRPKTAEAWAVHYADILDGRMEWLHDQVGKLEPGEWTPYQRLHDRYFWAPVREYGNEEEASDEGVEEQAKPKDEREAPEEPTEREERPREPSASSPRVADAPSPSNSESQGSLFGEPAEPEPEPSR